MKGFKNPRGAFPPARRMSFKRVTRPARSIVSCEERGEGRGRGRGEGRERKRMRRGRGKREEGQKKLPAKIGGEFPSVTYSPP